MCTDPLEVVQAGDVVQVTVIKVDLERGRIGLSMKDVAVGLDRWSGD